MVNVMKRVLGHVNINPDRLLLEWVSAAEGARFAQVVSDFTAGVREMGPLSADCEGNAEDLMLKLKAARNAVNGEKLRWVAAKQTEFKIDGNKYGEVFTSHEIGRYLDGVILEEIMAQQILILLDQGPLSIKELSEKLNQYPPDVLRHVLALLRKELVRLSEIRDRSPLYTVSSKQV